MARGRMLNKKISEDKKMVKIWKAAGCQGLVVHTWLIAHLDRDGRTNGDPAIIRAKVTPRIPDINEEIVIKTLCASCGLGIIRWYEADDDLWVEYLHFRENQRGMRYATEAPSDCPPYQENKHSHVRTYCDNYCDSKCDSKCNSRCEASFDDVTRKGKERKEIERKEKEATPDSGPTPEPVRTDSALEKARISSASDFSSLSSVVSQMVPHETPEASEPAESISTKGEFLDACVQAGLSPALSNGGHDRLKELLLEAPISADEFRFALNEATLANKRTAGYVVGTVRGLRIDQRDSKHAPPKKTPTSAPGNGASGGAKLPVYVAPTPPPEEKREADISHVRGILQALQYEKENTETSDPPRD